MTPTVASQAAQAIVEPARAKVNLTLRVLGRRADGYHALESLVAFARAPADLVTMRPHQAEEPASVAVTGPGASAILGENLIARALRLASEAAPGLRLGAVTLDKHLPVAAGVGGGSADAAAVLRALARANADVADGIDWPAIALKLGADVSVCLADKPAFMWGIGERMATIPDLPSLPAVIVNPMVAVPADKTAQVFRRLAAGPLAQGADKDPPSPGPFASAADVVALMRRVGNDLEPPALAVVPAIAEVKAALAAAPGCAIAQLSGGGPTCFGIFLSEADAQRAAASISATHPTWWVSATVLE